MNKPCEYCGTSLPLGVDKDTRRVRSHHFAHCEMRPIKPIPPSPADYEMIDLLQRVEMLEKQVADLFDPCRRA